MDEKKDMGTSYTMRKAIRVGIMILPARARFASCSGVNTGGFLPLPSTTVVASQFNGFLVSLLASPCPAEFKKIKGRISPGNVPYILIKYSPAVRNMLKARAEATKTSPMPGAKSGGQLAFR